MASSSELQLVAFCFAVGRFLQPRCEAIFLAVELFGVPVHDELLNWAN